MGVFPRFWSTTLFGAAVSQSEREEQNIKWQSSNTKRENSNVKECREKVEIEVKVEKIW